MRLTLRKESLAELTTDELCDVAGGTTPISRTCAFLTLAPCVIVLSIVEGCLPDR